MAPLHDGIGQSARVPNDGRHPEHYTIVAPMPSCN